jgi:hypothetical protein
VAVVPCFVWRTERQLPRESPKRRPESSGSNAPPKQPRALPVLPWANVMGEAARSDSAWRLVLVEWLDSFGCSPSWQELSDLKAEPLVCRSVGWLAYDGDDCKVVIPHISSEQQSTQRQGCGDMTIPTCAVLRIVDLAEAA